MIKRLDFRRDKLGESTVVNHLEAALFMLAILFRSESSLRFFFFCLPPGPASISERGATKEPLFCLHFRGRALSLAAFF